MDKRIKACIWVNGELRFADKAIKTTVESDLIIAADGGARHLSVLGIKPHIIIGDMDSIDRSLWENDVSIERIVVQEEKNKTDTELAVNVV
ncbi:MAG: thiamine diphosphokinase, partial [Chitinispirillia bacterium]|jgi:thiamine pyrophosphokinase